MPIYALMASARAVRSVTHGARASRCASCGTLSRQRKISKKTTSRSLPARLKSTIQKSGSGKTNGARSTRPDRRMRSSFSLRAGPSRAGRLLAGVLCFVVPALAVDWKGLKPQGYVSDFAGVVDAQSKAAIESYAARVQQATGAELAFVTVQSVEGEPIEDVANDLFHAWGIGKKGEDNGALLLL